MKDYMRGVVLEGSGQLLPDIAGYEVGGKTGTAEKLPRSEGKNLVPLSPTHRRRIRRSLCTLSSMSPTNMIRRRAPLAVQMASDIMKEIFPDPGITQTAVDQTAAQAQ